MQQELEQKLEAFKKAHQEYQTAKTGYESNLQRELPYNLLGTIGIAGAIFFGLNNERENERILIWILGIVGIVCSCLYVFQKKSTFIGKKKLEQLRQNKLDTMMVNPKHRYRVQRNQEDIVTPNSLSLQPWKEPLSNWEKKHLCKELEEIIKQWEEVVLRLEEQRKSSSESSIHLQVGGMSLAFYMLKSLHEMSQSNESFFRGGLQLIVCSGFGINVWWLYRSTAGAFLIQERDHLQLLEDIHRTLMDDLPLGVKQKYYLRGGYRTQQKLFPAHAESEPGASNAKPKSFPPKSQKGNKTESPLPKANESSEKKSEHSSLKENENRAGKPELPIPAKENKNYQEKPKPQPKKLSRSQQQSNEHYQNVADERRAKVWRKERAKIEEQEAKKAQQSKKLASVQSQKPPGQESLSRQFPPEELSLPQKLPSEQLLSQEQPLAELPTPVVAAPPIERKLEEKDEAGHYRALYASVAGEAKEQAEKTVGEIRAKYAAFDEKQKQQAHQPAGDLGQRMLPVFQLMCFIKKAFPAAEIFSVGSAIEQMLFNKPITDIDLLCNLSFDDPEMRKALQAVGLSCKKSEYLGEKGIELYSLRQQSDSVLGKMPPIDVRINSQIDRNTLKETLLADSLGGDFNVGKIYVSPQVGKIPNIYDPHKGLESLFNRTFSFIYDPSGPLSAEDILARDPHAKVGRLLRILDKGFKPADEKLCQLLQSRAAWARVCYPPAEPYSPDSQQKWLQMLDKLLMKGLSDELQNLGERFSSFANIDMARPDVSEEAITRLFSKKIEHILQELYKLGVLDILFFAKKDQVMPPDEKSGSPWFITHELVNELAKRYYQEICLSQERTVGQKFLRLLTSMILDPQVKEGKAVPQLRRLLVDQFIEQRKDWLFKCFPGVPIKQKMHAIIENPSFQTLVTQVSKKADDAKKTQLASVPDNSLIGCNSFWNQSMRVPKVSLENPPGCASFPQYFAYGSSE